MAGGSDDIKRALGGWADRMRTETIALARNWAGQLEAQAKTRANWADRTGNARAGLFGAVAVVGLTSKEVRIRLGHSVEYGVFLELAKDGRYAVLQPILDAAIPAIYATYERLWRG